MILFCDLSKKALKRAFRAEAIKTDGITRPTYYVGLVVSVRFGSFLPGICRLWNTYLLRWEFTKENKKERKQENTLPTKKAIKEKWKNDKGQEKKKKNVLSAKKATKKKLSFFLDTFLSRFLGRERVLILIFLLSCFLLKILLGNYVRTAERRMDRPTN